MHIVTYKYYYTLYIFVNSINIGHFTNQSYLNLSDIDPVQRLKWLEDSNGQIMKMIKTAIFEIKIFNNNNGYVK